MQRVAEPLPLNSSAILARALEINESPLLINGLHSPTALAMMLAHPNDSRLKTRPHLIVTSDLETAEKFKTDVHFFDPHTPVYILPHFDVPVFSGLYPSQKSISGRLNWLNAARNAKPGEIFVAPIESLLQRTIPFDIFSKNSFQIKRNFEFPIPPQELLSGLGYTATPTVEDVGTFAIRGGILDVFSPAHEFPLRIELYGDFVESMRFFNPQTQSSINDATTATLTPAREVLFINENNQAAAKAFSQSLENRDIAKEESHEILRAISLGQYFYGIEFILPYFYPKPSSVLDYFRSSIDVWLYDRSEIFRTSDQLQNDLKNSFQSTKSQIIYPNPSTIYLSVDSMEYPVDSSVSYVEKVDLVDADSNSRERLLISSHANSEFNKKSQSLLKDSVGLKVHFQSRLQEWRKANFIVLISVSSYSLQQKLKGLLNECDFQTFVMDSEDYSWINTVEEQRKNPNAIHLVTRTISSDLRMNEEKFIILRDVDIFGRRSQRTKTVTTSNDEIRGAALSFGEINPGDPVVHRLHGVGIYLGLKVMTIDTATSEFIELQYKDKDRLYLPVYRIGQLHRFVGPASAATIDKLGGSTWQKTKTKVRHAMRDMASKLLSLYAKRAQVQREPYLPPDADYWSFENTFPYEETPDQMRAINDVLADFNKNTPADRLVCGDVGFGKTEVAMRAAFSAVMSKRQVAIIAPTTILTFQHFENFKKRFAPWPIEIRVLNRFVSATEVKKAVQDAKNGLVDILIGTHRLLSKDVGFKNLGLLIVDEEQKFGVAHKERLRLFREAVDTIALSATPIPRTLNLSLVGLRDISFVNTPPEDRLPTRTFVSRFDPDLIRKSIEGEMARGGQVFFLHNRVQTIDEIASQLREIVPSARLAVAHGQMDEHQLEKIIFQFFNHEIDILVCTAIIESGMDIPKANTIFIDNAHTFGVSQLYQLRGRVGRSKQRAYCYLLIPAHRKIEKHALERLKVIQENTALGSGVRVAQYDLEVRGAGDILGEDQSGHIDAVGYELFLELLEEAIHAEKGLAPKQEIVEPEINLKISALIPDAYIPDLRMRLYYYKTLSEIREVNEVDKIESELRDQFGEPPDNVLNLLGIMIIRKYCRDLGVRDVSAGSSFISLSFTQQTPFPPQVVISLAAQSNKKYQLTPSQSLKVRMNEITWPRVVDELEYLKNLCPKN
jgi:transcription-repair coupling factor (superfamily II helicase)